LKPATENSNSIPARFTAWLVLFILPFIYMISELHATLLIELAGAAAALYVAMMLQSGKLRPNASFRALLVLLLTWLFLAGRSVFISVDPAVSWPVFVKAAGLAMLCLGTATALTVSRQYLIFYQAALWAGLLNGIMAINEYIEAPPIPSTWLDPASRELFRTRCAGIFTDPNIFAAFLATIMLLTLGALFAARGSMSRVLAALALTGAGIAIITTLSRGGWIGLACGLAAGALIFFKNGCQTDSQGRRLLLAVVAVLLLVFFAGPFKMRLFSIGNPADMTFAQRTLINKGIFGALDRMPVAGHGLHSFNQVYPRYRIVGGDYPMNAHNEFLHSMIETGFLSAGILALFALLLLKSAIEKRASNPDVACFTGVFVTLLIQNLSGFSSRILPTAAIIAMSAGAIMSFSATAGAAVVRPVKRRAAVILRLLAVLIVLLAPASFYLQQQMQVAGEALAGNHPELAIQALQNVINFEARNPAAHSLLATAFMQQGNLENATKMLQRAAALNPGEPIFLVNLARLAAGNDAAAATGYYRAALRLDPASEQFRLEFARFLLRTGKKSEALEELRTGLKFSPGFHDVYKGFREIETMIDQLTR